MTACTSLSLLSITVLGLVLGAVACDKPAPPPSSSTTVASASAAPASSQPTASASASGKPAANAPTQRSFLSFHGKVGSNDLRLVLERTGDKLEGIATQSFGDPVPLRGEMKDESHFVLTELAAKGKKGATYDGKLDGPTRITGTWKDPSAKGAPIAFTGGPPAAFEAKDNTFEQTYQGSLGEKVRIRMKLKREGKKLTGTYRYTRSKDDLHVEGTVNESDGKFELVEKSAKGVTTGRFEGVFAQRALAFARWSSPDGARSFPVTVRAGEAYPEPVTLQAGVKIVPQEEYKEQSKYCVMSIFAPEVVGAADKEKAKTLNQLLRAEAGDAKKMECEGASDELRYETTTSYQVDKTIPGAFALGYQFYMYSGGAHGMHSIECYVADVNKGSLSQTNAKILGADARKKLEALTNASLEKEHNTQKLSDEGFWADDVKLSDDTSICVSGGDLVVQFQAYEVAPYAMGAPAVKVSPKEAAPIVAGTVLAPFF